MLSAELFRGDRAYERYSLPWAHASDHIFCNIPRSMLFDLVVPDDVIPAMEFENGSSPIWHNEAGRLIPDPQIFRGC